MPTANDCGEDSLFKDKEDLKNELLGFIAYYNEHRPQSLLNMYSNDVIL